MSKVADLKNALTELFRKGTEVGYTETEIDEFLEGIDYHTLLQAVWDSAETVNKKRLCRSRGTGKEEARRTGTAQQSPERGKAAGGRRRTDNCHGQSPD